ncbi:hypothetical protein NQ317_003944 [Molorchus minor]|uniref:Uncharacterized protein n=1 Tax=Molorchus minor TaxID=1323400 RepID=A0ABQ9JES5_9CUCU|nr:hypothetical protein NQ317_003944 [Molorchus minor]
MEKLLHLKLLKVVMLLVGQWTFKEYNTTALKLYKILSQLIFRPVCPNNTMDTDQRICPKELQDESYEMICFYIQYTNTFVITVLAKYKRMDKVLEYIVNYEKNHYKKYGH